MPSFELQQYLQLRANGADVEFAAAQSGISLGEARLHEADIERGELKLPRACVQVQAHAREGDQPKEEAIVSNESIAADELRLLIERVERLHQERQSIADDIKDVFAEAKARGFDPAAMKRVIKLRKMEPHVRQEAEAVLAAYLSAVGMGGTAETVSLAVAA